MVLARQSMRVGFFRSMVPIQTCGSSTYFTAESCFTAPSRYTIVLPEMPPLCPNTPRQMIGVASNHASRTTSYSCTRCTLSVSCHPEMRYTSESRYTTLTASSTATGMSAPRDQVPRRGSKMSTVGTDRSAPDESTV
ncbi:MAG: hypothetical protein U5K74_11905 [Gemmatimonadaceae bacterium]|nr:hypothetical protein [Gemmatimonadaceae bacterium]